MTEFTIHTCCGTPVTHYQKKNNLKCDCSLHDPSQFFSFMIRCDQLGIIQHCGLKHTLDAVVFCRYGILQVCVCVVQ